MVKFGISCLEIQSFGWKSKEVVGVKIDVIPI